VKTVIVVLLAPLRGVVRFFYIWMHWHTISGDLKKRDERPREVEEIMRQLLTLERERHEAEKQKIARDFLERVKGEVAEVGDEIIDHVRARIQELQRENNKLFDAFATAVQALTVMLYIEESTHVRDRMLAGLPPGIRLAVNIGIGRFRERAGATATTPPPLRSGRPAGRNS
jgi:hypothetical protein